jgi:hypothetical protein
MLEWNHPTEPNGLLTGYVIELVADNGKVQMKKVSSMVTNSSIDQLTPDTSYVVQVDANNIVGSSSNCMNVTFKTSSGSEPQCQRKFQQFAITWRFCLGAESPSNFSVIALGPHTIVATWTEPHHFGHLIGYNVVYSIKGYNNSNVTVTVSKDQSMATISDLSPGTTFNLTVLAITKDSVHEIKTEGIPAPYQLVTTPGMYNEVIT